MKNIIILISLLVGSNSLLYGDIPSSKQKSKIQCNMTVKYIKRPKNVDSLSQLLTDGMFYGRFRTNNSIYEKIDKSGDSINLGGSLLYKSARYKHLSFTSSIYFNNNKKDTILTSAQSYIAYTKSRVKVKLGRFLIETLLAKSHDTGMIPNAFEGAYLKSSIISKNKIQLAYLTKQKLNSHDKFHHLLAFDENDDGAMHRGITLEKLNEKNIKDRLIIFEIENRNIKNLNLLLNYTSVPKLLSLLSIEGKIKFKNRSGLLIKPAIRYTHQFDNGAGEIGGANLRDDTRGYNNPNSLTSSILLSRVDFQYKSASLRLAYSKVADKGDIVAPWQSAPTIGYTSAMSQKNWYANSSTVMIRGDYSFSSDTPLNGMHIVGRYAIENFDDNKPSQSSDKNLYTLDFIKRFKSNPNLMVKLRTKFERERYRIQNSDKSYKKSPYSNEVRLEINYLF